VRSWNLERKLLVGVLALVLIEAAAGLAALVVLGRDGRLELHPPALIAAVTVGFLVVTLGLGIVVYAAGRALIRALQDIGRETELMSTVNPERRLQIRSDDEIGRLAAGINHLGDRLLEARSSLQSEVARATRDLTVERGKLSAVLEALGEGIAVATPDGRITLANHAAHRLLGASPGGLLGRSLFDFVDREKVAHFFRRLDTGHDAAERFSLQSPGRVLLDTVMTPFFDDERRTIGFSLVVRDATRPARTDEQRVRYLAEALRELRGSLASVRSLSESLLGDPAFVPASSRGLLEAIQAEALRLSGLVKEMDEPGWPGLVRPPEHFEVTAFADLAVVTLRRLPQESGHLVAVEADGDLSSLPPLTAEISALSETLAHLLRTVLGARTGSGKAWLRPKQRGRVLVIDAGAEGAAPVESLEAFLDVPFPIGVAGRATAREVIQQHAGEVWAYAERGRLGFRLTLPGGEHVRPLLVGQGGQAARTGFIGAGTVSGISGAQQPRPDFYDFSLFDEMGRHVLLTEREHPLDELNYVVFDIETTGLSPEHGDRIVSIAAVRVRAGAVKRGEIFDALVNPRRTIPAASIRFHGITDVMVADAPPTDVVLPAFLRFAEGAVLVGHQVGFDVRFLGLETARLGLPPITLSHPILDTLSLSELVHGSLPDHGLDAVAGRLGVTVRGRHSALGDALSTAEVFVRLLELLKRRGILRLGQALDAARELEAARLGDITPGAGP
jgi:DNA polymerase-3 subunit epsilon